MPFYIDDPGNYCRAYNNLELQIVATCELKTAFTSEVFQYGYLNPGAVGQALQISYAESDAFHATNSTAFFTVAWPDWVPPSLPIRRSALSTDAVPVVLPVGVSATHTVIPNWLAMSLLLLLLIVVMMCGYLLGLQVAKSQIQVKPVTASDTREKRDVYFPERV